MGSELTARQRIEAFQREVAARIMAIRNERDEARAEVKRLREVLTDLLAASAPYMTDAMPHEQLFSGQDLRNFEAFAAARMHAIRVLGGSIP